MGFVIGAPLRASEEGEVSGTGHEASQIRAFWGWGHIESTGLVDGIRGLWWFGGHIEIMGLEQGLRWE